jgi:hypothetical protein
MFDKMRKGAFLLMLAGLAVATLTGSPAGAESSRPAMSAEIRDRGPATPLTWENWDFPEGGLEILYNQLNNPSVDAFTSQNFELAYDAYDSFGADDVVIPPNVSWQIQGIGVDGIYGNCLPGCTANSFNVFFHATDPSGSLPKDPPVLSRLNQAYTVDPPGCDVAFTSPCTFRIFPLTPPVAVPAAAFPRHGWVSVQANMDFSTDGQWFWTARTVQNNDAAAWKNPGGGFGVCPTWAPMAGCLGAVDPDFMFIMVGTSTP